MYMYRPNIYNVMYFHNKPFEVPACTYYNNIIACTDVTFVLYIYIYIYYIQCIYIYMTL